MSPIGAYSAAVTDVSDAAPVAAAMQSQLQRLQQQLSELINAGNSKTPEGKAGIDAIRGQINQVEQRIAHSDQVNERRQAQLQAGKSEPAASVASAAGTVSQLARSSGPGQIIDVFA